MESQQCTSAVGVSQRLDHSRVSSTVSPLGSLISQAAVRMVNGSSPATDAAATAATTGQNTAAHDARAHRLSHAQALDYQALAKWVEQCLPFVALLAIVFVYHFFTGLFLCVWLGCSVHKANDVIRKIVAQTACEPYELAAAVIFVATNCALTLWLTGSQQWGALLLMPPPAPLSVWQVIFRVAITDSLVRCCGIIPKLLIAAATMRPSSSSGAAAADLPGGRRCSSDGAPVAATRPGGGVAWGPEPGSLSSSSSGSGVSCSRTSSLDSLASHRSLELTSSGIGGSSEGGGVSADGSRCSSGSGAVLGTARRTQSSGAALGCSGSSGSGGSGSGGDASPRGAPAPAPPRRTVSSGAAFGGAGIGASLHPGRLTHHGHTSPPSPSYMYVCARRRARLLALYDYVQASYRALLPIPVWHAYLLRSAPNALLSTLLATSYLTFKAYGIFRRGQLLLLATRLVLRTGALYGRYLRKGEIGMTGEPPTCPICQDSCSSPIRLDCSHVFCEDCLAEWLEREPTCPMCRCNVKPPGLSFGDGATTLLPQLF